MFHHTACGTTVESEEIETGTGKEIGTGIETETERGTEREREIGKERETGKETGIVVVETDTETGRDGGASAQDVVRGILIAGIHGKLFLKTLIWTLIICRPISPMRGGPGTAQSAYCPQ